MRNRKAFVPLAVALLTLGVWTGDAEAQAGWFFDAEAGAVLPVGNMGDALRNGPTFGVAAGQEFENVNVGLSFDIDLLPGERFTDPDTDDVFDGPGADFYRYHVFGEYGFLDPRRSEDRVNLVISAGGTTMSTDEFSDGESVTATYFSIEVGMHVGIGSFFGEGLWGGLFADSNDTAELNDFGTASTFIVKVGVRL
ncbi:MAG: hypothetical protein R3195_02045 [Gemmatimonadota bacterium]|nr:hypothetical protein [Gemmatimonadota bacterium]